MRKKITEKERACEMRAQGQTIPEIAHKLGVTKGSVSVWVRDVRLTEEQRKNIKTQGIILCLKTKKQSNEKFSMVSTASVEWFDKLNTKAKGNIAVIEIMRIFVRRGETISGPFGDNERYDLIWDNKGSLKKIQVKVGRLRAGAVLFQSSSNSQYFKPGYHPKSYKGQVDYFGIYCPELEKCYLVPVDDVKEGQGILRVDQPKNNQTKRVRWAKTYEMGV